MLNVALIGLLAGSLAITPPDGTGDAKKTTDGDKPAAEATPGVFDQYAADQAESPTYDTFAQGRPASGVPIKFWAQYAYGQSDDQIWDAAGNEQPLMIGGAAPIGTSGKLISQRVNLGAEVDFLNLPMFSIGAGGNLAFAQNKFQADNVGLAGIGDLESGWGVQGLKVYGNARGDVLGIHAGYMFDFGSDQTFVGPLPQDLPNSDGRDAIFFGADFDYPSQMWRFFGGIDYYYLQQSNGNPDNGDDFIDFAAGVGVRLGFVEIGAAAEIVTRMNNPTIKSIGTDAGVGGHAGTIVPYLRLSPPSLPVAIYVKGATPDEYNEYGIPVGGANSVKPSFTGVTAGVSFGFN